MMIECCSNWYDLVLDDNIDDELLEVYQYSSQISYEVDRFYDCEMMNSWDHSLIDQKEEMLVYFAELNGTNEVIRRLLSVYMVYSLHFLAEIGTIVIHSML